MKSSETHPATTFLRNLYSVHPGDFVELRALPINKKPGQERRKFVTTGTELVEFASKYGARNSGYGVYFGVAKRINDKAGKKENCAPVTALWVDVDTVKNGWDTAEVAKTFHSISGVLRPTICVNSGGGLHLYWLLDKPCTEHRDDVEALNRRLAELFGGDNVQNVDRILRLPGTFNNKRKAVECSIIWSYHWDKVDFDTLDHAAFIASQVFTGGKWEKESVVQRRVTVEFDPVSGYVNTLQAGNRNVAGNLETYWADHVRYNAPRGYVGVHEAQLVTTARLHCAGYGVKEIEAVIERTLGYTRKRMLLDAPEEAAGWNWDDEAKSIRGMFLTFIPKWTELKREYKAAKKTAGG